jgi:hypothetical protein
MLPRRQNDLVGEACVFYTCFFRVERIYARLS